MLKQFAVSQCAESTFFTIPAWSQFVPKTAAPGGLGCKLDFDTNGVGTAWLILAGVVDILLRIATLVSIFFFIFGAFKMVTSQGSPENIKSARETMTNALIGLVISIGSSWFLGYFVKIVFNLG